MHSTRVIWETSLPNMLHSPEHSLFHFIQEARQDPAILFVLADEATLAGVVGAAGSPVHPQPVPPGAIPHNHYTNAIREWLKREVLLVASTAVPGQVIPDLSCPAIPLVINSCIGSKIIPAKPPGGALGAMTPLV